MGLYEPDFAQLAMAACPALKKGLPALGSEAAQQAVRWTLPESIHHSTNEALALALFPLCVVRQML